MRRQAEGGQKGEKGRRVGTQSLTGFLNIKVFCVGRLSV